MEIQNFWIMPPIECEAREEAQDWDNDTCAADDNGEEDVKTDNYEYYTALGNNIFLPLNKVKIKHKLKAGLYSIEDIANKGFAFRKREIKTDKLYNLPIKELSLIINDISKFWKTETKFNEYGLVHKRGILLYGKAGCGKSCAIQMVINDLIKNQNGLVFEISNSGELNRFIEVFGSILRVIEPKRKVVCIIEDIDGLYDSGSKSTQTNLLNLLDGIHQSSNIVHLATTNYPERLEERILNRPSRFDKRYEFGLPNEEVREAYLKCLLKEKDLKNVDLKLWVKKTNELSLSHLRELIVSVIILGNDFEQEIENLKAMGDVISSGGHRKAGF